MSITVTIELQVKPDKLETLRSLFAALLSETRGREGNEGVTVHQDANCLSTIILLEKWRNKKFYEANTHWRSERGDLEKLSNLLERPLQRRFLDHVTV